MKPRTVHIPDDWRLTGAGVAGRVRVASEIGGWCSNVSILQPKKTEGIPCRCRKEVHI